MSKITLSSVSDITQATSAQTTINNNSTTVQTAFDNTLSRDGTSPNQMSAALDMNGQQIINLAAPVTNQSPLRLADVTLLNGSGTINVGPPPVAGSPVNVLTYGADRTGVAASNAAFATALGVCTASGVALYIPAGTYELGSGLVTVPSNITIFGDGPSLTILRMSVNAQSPVFYLNNVSNVEIRDLKILYSAGATSLGYAQTGVLLRNGCQNIKIKNISVFNINRGFNIMNSRAVICENLYTLNCTDAGIRYVSDHNAGVVLNAENSLLSSAEGSATLVEECIIHSSIFDGAATQGSNTAVGFYGISFQSVLGSNGDGMKNNTVSNCVICNTTTQAAVVAGVSNGISFNAIEARSSTGGGSVAFLTEVTGSDIPINTSYSSCSSIGYTYGFWNLGAPYTTYTACTVNGTIGGAGGGFYVSMAVNYLSYQGCIAASNTGFGFQTTGLSNSSIIGCISAGNSGNGFTMDGTGSATALALSHSVANSGTNYSIGAGVTQTGNL
jgi:hypothetical protein